MPASFWHSSCGLRPCRVTQFMTQGRGDANRANRAGLFLPNRSPRKLHFGHAQTHTTCSSSDSRPIFPQPIESHQLTFLVWKSGNIAQSSLVQEPQHRRITDATQDGPDFGRQRQQAHKLADSSSRNPFFVSKLRLGERTVSCHHLLPPHGLTDGMFGSLSPMGDAYHWCEQGLMIYVWIPERSRDESADILAN